MTSSACGCCRVRSGIPVAESVLFRARFLFDESGRTERYTLSLHDALPIHGSAPDIAGRGVANPIGAIASVALLDRKSTRLNSSHRTISYAVFCLKKKN